MKHTEITIQPKKGVKILINLKIYGDKGINDFEDKTERLVGFFIYLPKVLDSYQTLLV